MGAPRIASATAVIGQIPNQLVHCAVVRAVKDESALRTREREARRGEFLQVEGGGGRSELQSFRDLPRRHAGGPLLDEQAIDRKAIFVRESGKSFECRCRIHVSNIMEEWRSVKTGPSTRSRNKWNETRPPGA